MAYELKGFVRITGSIKAVTPLHIGGQVEGYEIGGMDNPVIREPVTGYPYIPGSSLKGKMRSLMEWAMGKVHTDGKDAGEVHKCDDPKCEVCRIFGSPAEEARTIGPTRLVVRDAWPTEKTREMMDQLQREKGLPKTEWKSENTLNRITSKANPRTVERVPKDSEFDFEFVYGIYDTDDNGKTDIDYLKHVFEAMRLIENSYLGGHGTRGSGKVEFNISSVTVISKNHILSHQKGHELEKIQGRPETIDLQPLQQMIQEALK